VAAEMKSEADTAKDASHPGVGWQLNVRIAEVISPFSSQNEILWVENLIKFSSYRRFDRRMNLTLSAKIQEAVSN
jgi:hypothetical protein